MMRESADRSIRGALLAVVVAALGVAPAAAQKATYAEDFETMSGKFSSLADAMGADTYDWRPMEGVRSVSEVYMLIAAEAYYMPSFWGAEAPDGIEVSNALFSDLASVTDKSEVLDHLAAALAHTSAALSALPEGRLEEEIPFFGQQRTISAAIYLLLTDMHEHLGQAIAYARSNEVVPPWSAGG